MTLGPFTSKLFAGVSLVLLVLCVSLLVRGNVWKDRAAKREAETQVWREAFTTQKKAYRAASAAAKAHAAAARLRQETLYEKLANETDQSAADGRDAVLAAADRYAAAHRVRPEARGADGAAGPARAGAQGGDPAYGARPGRDAELVSVTRQDFDICTINTHRLVWTHDWARRMITEGRAVQETLPADPANLEPVAP